jgi:hypothetical protein
MDALKYRHCQYYSKRDKLKHVAILDINKAPREPYSESYKNKNNVHLGQRKLALSEIQVITTFYKEFPDIHPIILYIGSAPGSHMLLLHKLFPKVKFILYDGAKFNTVLNYYPNAFEIHQKFVDVNLIKELKKTRLDITSDRLIFISDIRSSDNDPVKFENGVQRDLLLQQEWVKILHPALSLLKFRFPYNISDDKYPYMKGDIYFQIWAPVYSAETRLLVRQKDINKVKKYSIKKYEDTLFFHNKYDRVYCYSDKYIDPIIRPFIYKSNLYCPCYDCIGELNILCDYCQIMKKDIKMIVYEIDKVMNKLGKNKFANKNNNNELIELK